MGKHLRGMSVAAGVLCAGLSVHAEDVKLPDGPGKEVVQTACTTCHALQMLTFGGHDAEDWQLVMERMITAGAKVPAAQVATVTAYLAKNFPEQPRPAAVVIPGPTKVTFKEWDVPTKGSRPHDPLATADGAMWYTGMYSNKLGRVDMKTGEIQEYRIQSEGSRPHGLTADPDGNIWFTANAKGYVGKLNPKNGEVTEYALPEGTRDPHTPIFDQHGMLWFTAQGANRIGRINPRTGEVKVVDLPTPRSNPYGMVVNSEAVPFAVLFGTNKIASIDPVTMAVTEYVLPNKETRPRRIAITSDDVLWYADYSRGYLGRFDPKTGKATEYPSPGGRQSMPYGIASINDVIWYSESNTKPNTIVRFDPKSERFQTWIIPGGGGVVRNVSVTRDGNLLIAESAVNKVGVVEIAK